MEELMRKIGEKTTGLFVRYDPYRHENKFTVCVDGWRVCDTDKPIEILQWLWDTKIGDGDGTAN